MKQFYTMTFDGVAEDRQSYVQKEVGDEKDWNNIIKVFSLFDSTFDTSAYKWKRTQEARVSIKDAKE